MIKDKPQKVKDFIAAYRALCTRYNLSIVPDYGMVLVIEPFKEEHMKFVEEAYVERFNLDYYSRKYIESRIERYAEMMFPMYRCDTCAKVWLPENIRVINDKEKCPECLNEVVLFDAKIEVEQK